MGQGDRRRCWTASRTISIFPGRKVAQRPFQTEDDQRLLDGVQVRLLRPDGRARFDQLLRDQHYLQSADRVGEQVRSVAEDQGQWVALLAWCAGADHLKAREAWIGWTAPQKKRRRPLAANHSRFLILEGWHGPNLARRVMKLCLQRLSPDWTQTYGHAVLVAGSFVDPPHFLGPCDKASGWTRLGQTRGRRRVRQDFHRPHDRPPQLWVRELRPGARTGRRGRNLPAPLRAVAAAHPPECPQTPAELEQMAQGFAGLSDWRTRRPDFPLNRLVAVSLCAMLCGVCLGPRDLAAFAADLTLGPMAALRFPRDWTCRHRRSRPPGGSSFCRMLTPVPPRPPEAALLAGQDHVPGRREATDDLGAVDGKELPHSQGLEIVSASSVRAGRWLGSEPVAEGSNEIPAAQALLRRADLEGALVPAAAMHPQTETARSIVQERGADSLLPVQGNQKGVSDPVRPL